MKLYYGNNGYEYTVLWKSDKLSKSIQKNALAEMQSYGSCSRHSPIICFHEMTEGKIIRYFIKVMMNTGVGRSNYVGQCYMDELNISYDYIEHHYFNYEFYEPSEVLHKSNNQGFSEDIHIKETLHSNPLSETELKSIIYWILENSHNKRKLHISVKKDLLFNYDQISFDIAWQIINFLPSPIIDSVGFTTYCKDGTELSDHIKFFISDEEFARNDIDHFVLGSNQVIPMNNLETKSALDLMFNNFSNKEEYLKESAAIYCDFLNTNTIGKIVKNKKELLFIINSILCNEPMQNSDGFCKLIEYSMTSSELKQTPTYSILESYIKENFNIEVYLKYIQSTLQYCRGLKDFDNFDLTQKVIALNQLDCNTETQEKIKDNIKKWMLNKIYGESYMNMTLEEKIDWQKKVKLSYTSMNLYYIIDETVQEIIQVKAMELDITIKQKIQELIDGWNNLDDTFQYNEIQNNIKNWLSSTDQTYFNTLVKEKETNLKNEKKQREFIIDSRENIASCREKANCSSLGFNEEVKLIIKSNEFKMTLKDLTQLIKALENSNHLIYNINYDVFHALLDSKILDQSNFLFAVNHAKTEKMLKKVLDYFLLNNHFNLSSSNIAVAFSQKENMELKKKFLGNKEIKKRYKNTVYYNYLKENNGKNNFLLAMLISSICMILILAVGTTFILVHEEKVEYPSLISVLIQDDFTENMTSFEKRSYEKTINDLIQYTDNQETAIEEVRQYSLENQNYKENLFNHKCLLGVAIVSLLIVSILSLGIDKFKLSYVFKFIAISLFIGNLLLILLSLFVF